MLVSPIRTANYRLNQHWVNLPLPSANKYWLVIALLIFFYFPLIAQPIQSRQLQQALNRTQQTTRQARFLYELSMLYAPMHIDSARSYGEKSLVLAKHQPDQRLLMLVYSQLGHIYDQLSRPNDALSLLNKALQLTRYFPKDTATGFVHASMATFFFRQGDQEKALKEGLEALRLYESQHQLVTSSVSYLYNILGSIYSNTNNISLALDYYNRQQQLAERLHDPLSMARATGNKGDLYLQIGNLDKAEAETKYALSLLNPLQHKYFISVCLSNLGSIYFRRHQYKQAIAYHNQSLTVRQQLGVPIYRARSYLHLAECYYALADYSTALSYSSQAIDLFKKANTQRAHLQKSLEIKARTLAKMDNRQDAYEYLEKAMALKDSLSGVEKTKAIAQVQAAFDLERNQHQITLLHKNLAIQRLQIDQRQKQLVSLQQAKHTTELKHQLLQQKNDLDQHKLKLQQAVDKKHQALIAKQQSELEFARLQRLLYSIILAMLVCSLGLIGYYSWRRQIAQRQLLVQKQEIQQQAQELTKLNATKDKLFSLISHDLRSPVAHLKQSFWTFQQQFASQPELTEQLRPLEIQIDQLLDLLTNLLIWARNQLAGTQALLQPINLAEIANKEISQLAPMSYQKEIRLINQIDSQLQVLSEVHQLGAVMRNLISNAIKFTPRGGYIRLSTFADTKEVILQIRDTGIGMNTDQLMMLFDEPQVRRGTQGESGTGLGLRLSRELIQSHSGHLTVQSKEGIGTTVCVHLLRVTDPTVKSVR